MASVGESLSKNTPSQDEQLQLNRKINDNIKDEAHKLTSHIFDPYRSSPPNNWNTRLKNRLALFTDKNDNSILKIPVFTLN